MVQLTDTLTGAKIALPEPPYEVKLYVCGVTPYTGSHIGHAVFSIVFDVLRRYLEYRDYSVRHIQNFTDIDDKLIDRANGLGMTVKALADQYSEKYLASLERLNVLPATLYPRATEEIDRILQITGGLIDAGFAYASGGDVYYRVRRKGDYGKLSHRNIDDLLSGARIDPTELKEDPLDFALWKGAKPGEPAWDSPWGPGRPGWHIECSAMSYGHLGEQIDIHGGGADLIFPHHENEIAQTEAFTGKVPFARIWMHNALLQMGDEKMSKSLGNVKDLDETLTAWGADAVRLFIISSHYRSPLTYKEEALDAAKTGAERLRAAWQRQGEGGKPGALAPGNATFDGFRQRFDAAMDDDLNTPQAVAVLFDLSREINREADRGGEIHHAQALLRELASVLGLTLAASEAKSQEAAPFIDLLVELRRELRAAKQFALADRVRDGLVERGVELQDSATGTAWSLK